MVGLAFSATLESSDHVTQWNMCHFLVLALSAFHNLLYAFLPSLTVTRDSSQDGCSASLGPQVGETDRNPQPPM